jgi:hypothetical protein
VFIVSLSSNLKLDGCSSLRSSLVLRRLLLEFTNSSCTYKKRGWVRTQEVFNSIASHSTCTPSSQFNQWISSLLSSPTPPTLPRLSPHPPLPSMPMVEEAVVPVAALSPRRVFLRRKTLYDIALTLLITGKPTVGILSSMRASFLIHASRPVTRILLSCHIITSRISFNSCSRVRPGKRGE